MPDRFPLVSSVQASSNCEFSLRRSESFGSSEPRHTINYPFINIRPALLTAVGICTNWVPVVVVVVVVVVCGCCYIITVIFLSIPVSLCMWMGW